MSPLLVIALAGAGLWVMSKSKGPMAIERSGDTVNALVLVFDEDGKLVSGLRRGAAWHSTPEQTAKFGPRVPDFYTYDEGGLFAFVKPNAKTADMASKGLVDPSTGKLFSSVRDVTEFYKPTWKVEVS